MKPVTANDWYRKEGESRPVLPEGWKYFNHPSKYIMVESPQGKRYLIERERAFTWNPKAVAIIKESDNPLQFVTLTPFRFSTVFDWIRTLGRLGIGNIFVPGGISDEVII